MKKVQLFVVRKYQTREAVTFTGVGRGTTAKLSETSKTAKETLNNPKYPSNCRATVDDKDQDLGTPDSGIPAD